MSKISPEASFCGIKFYLANHSSDFGYRYASNSLPFYDQHEHQKLGKKCRTYDVSGFLLGEDYFKTRDELISKVEEGGDGELIHPYFGRLSVVCAGITINESSDKGRYCFLSFKFIESSKSLPLEVSIDNISSLVSAIIAAKNAILNKFRKVLSAISKLISYASDKLKAINDFINEITNEIRNIEDTIARIAQVPIDLALTIKNAINMVDRGGKLFDFIDTILSDVAHAFENAILEKGSEKHLTRLDRSYKNNDGSEKHLTRSERYYRNKEKYNALKKAYSQKIYKKSNMQNQMDNLLFESQKFLKINALCSACLFASKEMEISSVDETKSIRDDLISSIDEIIQDPKIDSDLFIAFSDLRSNVFQTMSKVIENLPPIKYFNINEQQNLLTFCFENFGSISDFDEIMSLNNIEDPAFIKDGTTLMGYDK